MKFTIITPYLPNRPTITRAVSCVDSQTYTNWEHIIQIDSPDKVLTHAITEDARRKVFRCDKWHEGFTGNWCRANAFDEATGGWILYLDDDDILYPNALQEVAAAIERDPAKDWGYFGILRLGEPFFNHPPAVNHITGGQIFHKKYINGEPIQWAREILYSGDWELIDRCLVKYPALLVDEVLGELPEYHSGQEF